MFTKILRVIMIGAVFSAFPVIHGCAIKQPALSINACQLEGSYGRLGFYGKVTETAFKDRIHYAISDLHVMFIGKLAAEHDEFIDITEFRITASTKQKSTNLRWNPIYRKAIPISTHVSRTTGSIKVDDLHISISRDIIHNADHIGFSFSNGTELWPADIELLTVSNIHKQEHEIYSGFQSCPLIPFDDVFPTIPWGSPPATEHG
jgi:hypothetical protein